MKSSFLISCILIFATVLSFAQGTVDTTPTAPKSSAIDITSILIGLAVGLVIGYLLGSKTAKK